MRKQRMAVLLFCLSMVGTPAFAHHGNSAYDHEHPLTLTGTVAEFDFVNPHSQIYMDVKDNKGNLVRWGVEGMSPGILTRNGWNRNSIKRGDQVTITLIPAKNGQHVGFSGMKVTFADGRPIGDPKKVEQ